MSKNHIPYFRFYPSDFMNGVRGLSAQEVGVYMMILCRIYEENGAIEYNPLRLSTYCGMREKTFTQVIEKLFDLGKLTSENGMVSNDRAEGEIQSRANDLKNNSKAGKASAEKRQQNQRLISTGVQRTFNHTDTDTDTLKELPSVVTKKEKQAAKKGTRLPEDWTLSEGVKDWIRSKGFGRDFVMREFEKFKNFWISKSGTNATKLDWDATFRNWLLNADEKKPAQRMTIAGAAAEALQKMRNGNEQFNTMEYGDGNTATGGRTLSLISSTTKPFIPR